MIYLLYAVCAVAVAYQLVALAASLRQWTRTEPAAARTPGVSVLKPVRGHDAGLLDALRSIARQNYPQFEVLIGVARPDDPALASLRALAAEFPPGRVGVFVLPTDAPNRKAGVMAGLEQHAQYPIVLAGDADISVPPDYLRRIVAPLENPAIGLVTCIYRAPLGHILGPF